MLSVSYAGKNAYSAGKTSGVLRGVTSGANRGYVLAHCGGGGRWPTANQKRFISGTKGPIDINLVYKFKFLCCLEVYLRKSINLDHEGALEGPFLQMVP